MNLPTSKKNIKNFPEAEILQEFEQFVPKIAGLGKLSVAVWSLFLDSCPSHDYFMQNNKLPFEFFKMLKCILSENTTLTKLDAHVCTCSVFAASRHSFSQL